MKLQTISNSKFKKLTYISPSGYYLSNNQFKFVISQQIMISMGETWFKLENLLFKINIQKPDPKIIYYNQRSTTDIYKFKLNYHNSVFSVNMVSIDGTFNETFEYSSEAELISENIYLLAETYEQFQYTDQDLEKIKLELKFEFPFEFPLQLLQLMIKCDSNSKFPFNLSLLKSPNFHSSKLLGSGSYGCTYTPPLLCSNNLDRIRTSDELMKVQSSKHAEKEQQFTKFIQAIDPQGRHFIPLSEEYCQIYHIDPALRSCQPFLKSTYKRTFVGAFTKYGGISLNTYILEQDVHLSTVFQWIKDISLKTDLLSSHNLVHRDLKGDNILIHPDGRLRLIDFGLAMFLDQPIFDQGYTHLYPLWYAVTCKVNLTQLYTDYEQDLKLFFPNYIKSKHNDLILDMFTYYTNDKISYQTNIKPYLKHLDMAIFMKFLHLYILHLYILNKSDHDLVFKILKGTINPDPKSLLTSSEIFELLNIKK